MASTESLISSHLEENPNGMPPTRRGFSKAVIIVFSLGIVAVIIGPTLGILWMSIFNGILRGELVLSPTSTSYSLWKETPIPMYLELRLFNWTNPEDFYASSEIKPNFVEMGPYVFKEVDSKVNQVWNKNNNTITFQQRRVWHFDESRSVGSLSDEVTNLNPIVATAGYMMRYQDIFIKWIVNSALKATKEKLTVTKTVRELLFDGYKDKFLDTFRNITSLPYDKFGWFYGRNNSDSYDGTFNMLTGAMDLKDLGYLEEWNYSNRSKFYSDSCGAIGGSLGDLWPPIKGYRSVTVFAPDVCTSMTLTYNEAKEYLGVVGSEYISDKNMLDNGTNVPSRACYCKNVDCQPSGAFNVSQCKFGAPAFISLPHFYLADESYRSAIDGMKPRKDEHQFSVVVEPTAGIPMQVSAKLQLNLLVEPDKSFSIFSNITRTFIPILWFKQEANLTESLAGKVKFIVILPMLGHVTFFGICGIGFLLMFIAIGIFIKRIRQSDDGQILIPKAEGNGVIT